MSELMTIAELVATLRVSESTVRRLVWTGVIRSSRVGRQIRVQRDDLIAYLVGQGNPAVAC
jgi:excisionase family DNA binding protein